MRGDLLQGLEGKQRSHKEQLDLSEYLMSLKDVRTGSEHDINQLKTLAGDTLSPKENTDHHKSELLAEAES